jgi:Zn finger protein HypA/HybF involved in hydrogenase expression
MTRFRSESRQAIATCGDNNRTGAEGRRAANTSPTRENRTLSCSHCGRQIPIEQPATMCPHCNWLVWYRRST